MKSADGKFIVIDVPGTNDPGGDTNRRLTNEVISEMFVETLEREFIYEHSEYGKHESENDIQKGLGINAITHVVMLDEGLRIKTELMKSISDILLVFTMCYQDFELLNAPRINVVFTAFSRVDNEENKEDDPYGEEVAEQKSQSEQWKEIKEIYKT